jgi:hypothetical protein
MKLHFQYQILNLAPVWSLRFLCLKRRKTLTVSLKTSLNQSLTFSDIRWTLTARQHTFIRTEHHLVTRQLPLSPTMTQRILSPTKYNIEMALILHSIKMVARLKKFQDRPQKPLQLLQLNLLLLRLTTSTMRIRLGAADFKQPLLASLGELLSFTTTAEWRNFWPMAQSKKIDNSTLAPMPPKILP